MAGRGGSRRRRESGSCRRRGEGGSGSRADGPLPNLGSCQPCDSRAYVSRVTEGFALTRDRRVSVCQPCDGGIRPRPSEGSPSRATFAARPVGFRRPRGLGAAWRGRGFALGPRDRPQYSPDCRVIVSCRGARASVVSGAAGGWLEGHDRRSAGGLPPDEGGWVPLGRVGGWTVTWIVELGTLAGAADERRGGRRRLRDAVGPGAAARGDDLVVAGGPAGSAASARLRTGRLAPV